MKNGENLAQTITYLSTKMGAREIMRRREVHELLKELIDTYEFYISKNDISRAWMLETEIWRDSTSMVSGFFRIILMHSYHVYDETHGGYQALLEAIKENNPEWAEAFEADHKRKLARCKVPIWTGSQ